VEPDLITIAKSIAGGMPLSAVVGRKEIMDSPHVGGLGGTYSGNPLACRAALAVLEVFEEENLLEKAVNLGETLQKRFKQWQQEFDIVADIRGIGPMLALELVKDHQTGEPAADEAKSLVKFCYERGLIILTCGHYGNIIRTLIPLVITDDQLERGLSIMEDGLASLSKS